MAAKRLNREFELDGEIVRDLMNKYGFTVQSLGA